MNGCDKTNWQNIDKIIILWHTTCTNYGFNPGFIKYPNDKWNISVSQALVWLSSNHIYIYMKQVHVICIVKCEPHGPIKLEVISKWESTRVWIHAYDIIAHIICCNESIYITVQANITIEYDMLWLLVFNTTFSIFRLYDGYLSDLLTTGKFILIQWTGQW